VTVDPEYGVVGIGDSQDVRLAERMAAFHACLQLAKLGRFDKHDMPVDLAERTGIGATKVKLTSSGMTIDVNRARTFIDYYCHRFKFGKPDVQYSELSGKKGKSPGLWSAMLHVEQRQIGGGKGRTKKEANSAAYLDTAKYLDECDPELWKTFASEVGATGDFGKVPHVEFGLTPNVEDFLHDLVHDASKSELYSRASALVERERQKANQGEILTATSAGAQLQLGKQETPRRQEALKQKSAELLERLQTYQANETLSHLRAQRASLPVTAKAADIIAKVDVNPVTVLVAATGSGTFLINYDVT
jgi:small subunit ribosomal protein S24e